MSKKIFTFHASFVKFLYISVVSNQKVTTWAHYFKGASAISTIWTGNNTSNQCASISGF